MKKLTSTVFFALLLIVNIPASADDTDIFSGATSKVPPNVLIIFDSSGTMKDPIDSTPYIPEPSDYYEGKLAEVGKSHLAVDGDLVYYYYKSTCGGHECPKYDTFPPAPKKGAYTPLSVDGNYCATAKAALTSSGWWMGNIETTPNYPCEGNTFYRLYSGNYLNYLAWLDNGGSDPNAQSKVEIAQDVIGRLLDSMDDDLVRFGLMIYNSNQQGQGGELIAPVGSTDAYVKSQIQDEILARQSQLVSDTPLAETLIEAGLYFSGKQSWSSNVETSPYTSPVQWRCQRNYVILMTDGLSTSDEGLNNRHQDIINNVHTGTGDPLTQYFNKVIGDYDNDGVDPATNPQGGTHWLDDVAKFLHTEDLLSGSNDLAGKSFDEDAFHTQNITVYAVGFDSATDFSFLARAVDDQHGNSEPDPVTHPHYFTARTGNDLEMAFQEFLGQILAANSSFIAPVVPVNRLNKVYSGNSVYLSLFKPDATFSFWRGNLKKFGLSSAGELLQDDGSPATDDDGQILPGASSCWRYSSSDGSVTEKGGAGEELLNQTTRNFYTYRGVSTNLKDTTNAFSTANDFVKAQLGATIPVTDPDDLINFLTAQGNYDPQSGTTADKRTWVLGDILHSKPITMFSGDDTIIFAGSNDGFFHAFVDTDASSNNDDGTPTCLSDDTLTEAWCFAPWDLLPNLHYLHEGSTHHYFVDGSPVLFEEGSSRYVTFGLRRGGSSYYTLNVGDLNGSGYDSPLFAWGIGSDFLSGHGDEDLGQSWCRPWVSTIKDTSGTARKVLLFTGGYDDDNQDLDTPESSDTKGRAIFAVDASTGNLQENLNFNHGNPGQASMTNCFVELVAFDHDTNGLDDTIYAGSLGGDLFGFQDRGADGNWQMVKVFQARSGSTASSLLKFFYEPDIALETFGDYVYIGTGDREHPSYTATVDRFYGIKNTWSTSPTTLTEADLIDVTPHDYNETLFSSLQTGNGWFIKFDEHSGEKVVSPPLLYSGTVFFTTYSPEPSGDGSDMCSVEGLGGGRLYAVDYLTGKAVLDFNGDGDTDDRADRYLSLGVGIPSPPTLVVTEDGGAKLIIGTGGPTGTTGAKTISIPSTSSAKLYYWKQD